VFLAERGEGGAPAGILDDRHARTVAAGRTGRYGRDIASLSLLPGE
jgi:hypothetical protein